MSTKNYFWLIFHFSWEERVESSIMLPNLFDGSFAIVLKSVHRKREYDCKKARSNCFSCCLVLTNDARSGLICGRFNHLPNSFPCSFCRHISTFLKANFLHCCTVSDTVTEPIATFAVSFFSSSQMGQNYVSLTWLHRVCDINEIVYHALMP